nr:dienelactone hydrolase family protein [Rhodopirellula sp. SM50]
MAFSRFTMTFIVQQWLQQWARVSVPAGIWLATAGLSLCLAQDSDPSSLQRQFPAAKPLEIEGDIAAEMVDGIDRFLLAKLNQSAAARERHWQRDFTFRELYLRSVQPNRDRLARMLGAHEDRVDPVVIARNFVVGSSVDDSLSGYRVYSVRWPVLEDPDPGRSIVSVYGEGLLLEPIEPSAVVANVVALPDCDQTPGQISGIADGIDPELQFARRLAERDCRVLVPMLVSREINSRGGRAKLTSREYIYRAAFELGRHPIGYEVQMVRAAIDSFDASRPIGVIGAGEGGRVALATAALDQRVDALCVGGSFGASERVWTEPIDRNVFGWLAEFGNAETLTLVAPRKVLINHAQTPARSFDGSGGGAPGTIHPIDATEGRQEVERARQLVRPLIENEHWQIDETAFRDAPCDQATTDRFVEALINRPRADRQRRGVDAVRKVDEAAMQTRLVEHLDRHNQLLLRESPFVRREFMKDLNTNSIEDYVQSSQRYRQIFRDDVIGHFDDSLLPPNARVRQTWQQPGWTGYEVVLDVFEDVIAYGVLIVPDDMKPGEKRPVVVCQHGLEGRPTDTFLGDHRAYHDFAAQLARRGFITFAPQNPYLFKDRFRTLQRKANPLGKTLFSVIVPQQQQIVNWLKSLPQVDPQRIAFYGLSYGGKSAMRIPALVTDYCLSICSADFNEWVLKNASTRHPFSYVGTGEYEIFEWNLGETFNYSEMAALICPRPFMVERGHFDGVATDQWVAHEYAKVRNLYAARLKIGERTEIEWFDGPHTINGQGTFEFLHKHLNWPKPPSE